MINIAIMGYGTVGSGVAEVCSMNRESINKKLNSEIFIKKILDVRDFPNDPLADRFTKNPDDIFQDPEISIVVETIGGVGIAYEFTKRALEAGKSVVTSNKELVATHGPELLNIAYGKKLCYLFEASVGGGIPIIRPLNKCLSANQVESIYGILNGTTNYILTNMKKSGISFEEALKKAQELGFAEQNPTADIEGHDTCRKIAILSSIASGDFIDYHEIFTEGIARVTDRDIAYADMLKSKIKLIAMAKRDPDDGGSLELRVAPTLLPDENPMNVADNEFNAILIEGNALGPAMFYGRGAGKLATASAVLADVIEAALHIHLTPHKVLMNLTNTVRIKKHADCRVKAFIRLTFSDGAGEILEKLRAVTDVRVLGSKFGGEIAAVFGENKPVAEGEVEAILGRIASPKEERTAPECLLSMIRLL